MSLTDFKTVFNTVVRFKEPLGLAEDAVSAFFTEVTAAVPELDDYRHVEDEYFLCQMERRRPVRQLKFEQDRITMAFAKTVPLAVANGMASAVYPLISQCVRPNPLLIDFMDVSFRFEFAYAGNHDEFLLRTFFADTPLAQVAGDIEGAILDFQPSLRFSIDQEHTLVAALDLRSGSTVREIESGDFSENNIEVLFGLGLVKGLTRRTLQAMYGLVYEEAEKVLDERVIPFLVERLDGKFCLAN